MMPRALPSITTRSSISVAREHRHATRVDLRFECLIRAEQKLLACLAARIERSGNLRAAEGAFGEESAVFTREGTPCATHWSMMLTLFCARR